LIAPELLVPHFGPFRVWCGTSLWLFFVWVLVRNLREFEIPEATPSTPQHKKPQTVEGYAFLVASTLHSSIVGVLSVRKLVAYYFEPSDVVRLGLLFDPEYPTKGSGGAEIFEHHQHNSAFVGEFYISWVLFEIIFIGHRWKKFGKLDDMLHHLLFFAVGVLIRFRFHVGGRQLIPFYANALMAMEISTPFLNLHLGCRGTWADTFGKVRLALVRDSPW
jgi:hypothetical protein